MSREIYELLQLILTLNLNFVIIPYLSGNLGKAFRIKKIYDRKRIIKASVTPTLKQKYNDIELNKISNKDFKDATLEFAELLVSKFPKDTLVNFYNNINELVVKKNHVILLIGASGCYNNISNVVSLSNSASIYHELFHMASRTYDKETKNIYAGFSQKNFKLPKILYEAIGTGINEGYTELLAHRYFGDKHNLPKAYEFEVDIAKKIEVIIGSDKMTSLYLNGNLMGLIEELKKYMPEDDVLKFINRLDLINEYDFSHKSIIIRESIFDIYEFLLKTNALKLKKQYEEGMIDLETFQTLSNNYLELFNDEVNVSSSEYNLKNIEEMYNIILKSINAPGYASKHTNK